MVDPALHVIGWLSYLNRAPEHFKQLLPSGGSLPRPIIAWYFVLAVRSLLWSRGATDTASQGDGLTFVNLGSVERQRRRRTTRSFPQPAGKDRVGGRIGTATRRERCPIQTILFKTAPQTAALIIAALASVASPAASVISVVGRSVITIGA